MKNIILLILAHLFISLTYVFGFNKFQEVKSIQKTQQLTFTENKGQVSDQNYHPRPDVLYSGGIGKMNFHIKKNGISYQLSRIDSWKEEEDHKSQKKIKVPNQTTLYRVDLNWINTNTDFTISTDEILSTKKNYYLAVCPDGITGVKSFNGVTLQNIYNNISLHYYEKDGSLKYDYIIAPYADYKQIQTEIIGAELELNNDGSLIIKTPLGDIVEETPIVYQNGKKLVANWVVKENIASYNIDGYNPELELIIDPTVSVLKWGTYYGDNMLDESWAVTKSNSGFIYLAGKTESTSNIATSGSHQSTYGGANGDAFLAKFNDSGQREWATYYGGSNRDDGYAVTTDVFNNIYLAGATSSPTAISTSGCHQDTLGNAFDVFLVKFDSNGVREWGTYYGGSNTDSPSSIASDNYGNIYLAGTTLSPNNIGTAGAFQPSYSNSSNDMFVVKFNGNGIRQWGTYYGGLGDDLSGSIAIDKFDHIFLAGYSDAANLGTPGTHKPIYNGGGYEAMLVKFDFAGTRLWSTYFGSPTSDWCYSVTVDVLGNAYILGMTYSTISISTPGCHQPIYGGNLDGYLAKFDSLGLLLWATYYGGMNGEQTLSVGTDTNNNVYIAGYTTSPNNIATPGNYQDTASYNYNGFIANFNNNGIRQWGTYYGGKSLDVIYDMFVDKLGYLYVCGRTSSIENIATIGTHQPSLSTNLDAFLAKFGECTVTTDSIFPVVCNSYVSPSGIYTYTTSGIYNDTITNAAGCDSILIIDLVINNTSDSLYENSCDSYISPSGNYTWSATGTYFDTIPNFFGCDSNLTIILTIDTVDTSVTNSSPVLISNCVGATNYQWIDCGTMLPIAGETNETFIATTNGSYAVIVSQNGCTDTSNCNIITGVGVDEVINDFGILIYPNPNTGQFTIEKPIGLSKEVKMKLLDATSKLILDKVIPIGKQKIEIDITQYSRGVYYLQLIVDEKVFVKQILKD